MDRIATANVKPSLSTSTTMHLCMSDALHELNASTALNLNLSDTDIDIFFSLSI